MGQIEEAELAAACRAGGVLDGRDAGERRAVPAAVLRRCCHELRDQVDPRGVRLAGAVVTGQLDLAGLDVPFPVSFDDCDFEQALVVEGSELFGLSVTGSRLPGLLGNGVRIRRDLDLSGSRVSGAHRTSASVSQTAAIWLCESAIGGRLLCLDTIIDGRGGRAVQADRIRVGGNVRMLREFTARGQLRLIGAHIDGSIDLVGAQVEVPAGIALDLAEAVIEGTVFVLGDPAGRRPAIRGQVDMGRTRISGQLLVRDVLIEDRGADPDDRYSRSTSWGCALNAPGLSVGDGVVLEGRCELTGAADLTMSKLSGLAIGEECVLSAPGRSALRLINAEIRGDMRLAPGCRVAGTVRMAGAVIHGALGVHARLTDPERRSVLGATALVVDGGVDLGGLQTTGGRVNFRGALLGSVVAAGARLDNPGGYSLSLHQATVKGSVQLIDGFTSTGLLVLSRATIEGRLQCTGGSFSCPRPADRNENGRAIAAISATVRGGMDLGWSLVWPSADFTNATTTFLADDPGTWPPRIIVAGFTYDRFERPQGAPPSLVWDQAARCAWLSRQDSYDSGPYEQAARVFRAHGYSREAEEILMAQRRAARHVGQSGRGALLRAADMVYGISIGYGYRPWRVLWALAALLVLVGVSLALPASQATLRATDGNGDVYTTAGLLRTSTGAAGPAHADPCGDGDVRCFSPALYAVDTVIPLISLDQRATWYPDPHVRGGTLLLWWLNLATLLGWLLSSIFALSFARLARSA